ncbi:hypothetical protein [Bordetella trematum]|uniref:hypothetical protein n=1 Tax=Bordetella trematum TaxID=123899 RepID=UPI000D90C00B|nr:hypothetical protein [Bordetella trematum]SPU50288.1 Uncharacterised protein [Bordetella trematum]VDH08032.1 Uncharacterised protein [Bordetella trematum]
MWLQRSPGHDTLPRELYEAAGRQQTPQLRRLYLKQGPRAFARALGDLPGPAIGMALAALALREQRAVRRWLPQAARQRLHQSHAPDLSGGGFSLLTLLWR